MILLAAALIAGLPQGDVDNICTTVRFRQSYYRDRHAWEKAWVHLSWVGVDLSPKYRREIVIYCKRRGR
jgi:hypothetical protein